MDEFSIYREVIVPTVSSLIGALFALLIALRTEWGKRLARGDPHTVELWRWRREVYGHVSTHVSRANGLLQVLFEQESVPREMFEALQGVLKEHLEALKETYYDFAIVAGHELLQSGSQFLSDLITVAVQPHGAQISKSLKERIIKNGGKVVVDIRNDLCIDPLDEQTRQALATATAAVEASRPKSEQDKKDL